MKVLFIKESSAGKKGEVRELSSGYAENFLIPKGFAVVATPQIQAKLEKEGKEEEIKKLKEIEKLNALKADFEKREFQIKVKVGDKGQVFGGLHEKDVAKFVAGKMGINIDKSQLDLGGIIKAIGLYEAKLKLAAGIIAKLKINVSAL